MQNVYNQGKSQRTISLNSHYSVVFPNGRDASQFRIMAYQICESNGHWLVDAFTNATSKPYGDLVLDHHLSTPEDHTVAINILPGELLTYYINSHLKVKHQYNFLMENLQSKLKRQSNKLKVVIRTIKFLFVAPDLKVAKAVVQKALKEVITAISNAALNARQGAIDIPLHLIPLFKHHIHHFDLLCDCRQSILSKRHLIFQKGGALPIIVLL